MDNNKGFTLMEMIAVIGIVSLMALMVLPAIINQLAQKKTELGDSTKKIIYTAADLYFSNKSSIYPKDIGRKNYCVTLETLVNEGYLKKPLKDLETGKEIKLTRLVKTTVNTYSEYDDYSILEENTNCPT